MYATCQYTAIKSLDSSRCMIWWKASGKPATSIVVIQNNDIQIEGITVDEQSALSFLMSFFQLQQLLPWNLKIIYSALFSRPFSDYLGRHQGTRILGRMFPFLSGVGLHIGQRRLLSPDTDQLMRTISIVTCSSAWASPPPNLHTCDWRPPINWRERRGAHFCMAMA